MQEGIGDIASNRLPPVMSRPKWVLAATEAVHDQKKNVYTPWVKVDQTGRPLLPK